MVPSKKKTKKKKKKNKKKKKKKKKKEVFAKSYTYFAETAAFPPIISERTSFMTGIFTIIWTHSQISIKQFCRSYGRECG